LNNNCDVCAAESGELEQQEESEMSEKFSESNFMDEPKNKIIVGSLAVFLIFLGIYLD
jgi:hypothetical protein